MVLKAIAGRNAVVMSPRKTSKKLTSLYAEKYLKTLTVKMIASFKTPLNNDILCCLY